MDLQNSSDDHSGFWTNEKHVNFLNWMEASFVRSRLENDARSKLTYATARHAPLDRYLPDSSDSTRDLKHQTIRRKTTQLYFPEVMDPKIRKITNAVKTNENRKRRRRSFRPYDDDASLDQVVPQLENRNGDKHEESGGLKPLSNLPTTRIDLRSRENFLSCNWSHNTQSLPSIHVPRIYTVQISKPIDLDLARNDTTV